MRILLVEDNAGLGQAVREQLADDGHAVDWIFCASGAPPATRRRSSS